MALKINHTALAHARSLISQGKINKGEWKWDKSAHSPEELKKICLAVDESASEDTKERYLYPFGTEDEVSEKAISSAEGYAKKNGETELHAELEKLSEEIAKEREPATGRSGETVKAKKIMAETALPIMAQGDKAPTRFIVLPLGTYKGYIDPETGNKKEFTITSKEVKEAVTYLNQLHQRNPQLDIVIDNDHLTEKDTFAPAFGWIKELYDAGKDGLGAVVQWTSLGLQAVANKFYKYISPVFFFHGTDSKTGEDIPFGIASAALTNTPFFDELKPLVAKRETATEGTGDGEIKNLNDNSNQGEKMDKIMQMLRAWLKVKDDSTPEEIATALESKIKEENSEPDEESVAAEKVLCSLGFDKGTTMEQAKATVIMAKKSSEHAGDLAARLQRIEQETNDRNATELVDGAISEGKIFPSQREDMLVLAKKDLSGMKVFFAKAPVVGPINPIPTAASVPSSKVVTPEMEEMSKKLGLDPKEVAKHQ